MPEEIVNISNSILYRSSYLDSLKVLNNKDKETEIWQMLKDLQLLLIDFDTSIVIVKKNYNNLNNINNG